MTTIDTFAFLEFGDVKGNFKKWLSEFSNLSDLGISEDELWEYRNSIIHMTNAKSKKVKQNKVFGLTFYVSDKDVDFLTTNGEEKYFNLFTLLKVINRAIENWIKSYDINRHKFEIFFERYDTIISESRLSKIE